MQLKHLKKKQPEIIILFKGFHIKLINFNIIKTLEKVKGFLSNLKTTNCVTLPLKLERYTVLRSPHIDKKSREQFEIRTYKKLFSIKFDSKSNTELFLKKLKIFLIFLKNSSGGCNLKITFFL